MYGRESRYSSGRRGSGRKFSHTDAYKEDTDTRDGPAPDHCGGPTIWKGIDEDGGYGRQKAYDAESDPKDFQRSEFSPELLLVAQAGEESFVCLKMVALHGGGRDKRITLHSIFNTYALRCNQVEMTARTDCLHFTATEIVIEI